MKEISVERIEEFKLFLHSEERSEATVDKYIRDVRAFWRFARGQMIEKAVIMEYKSRIGESYAISSANSMLAALNSFFRFCGRGELCVKQFKLQRQAWSDASKELSRAEYLRLLDEAERQKKDRLSLIIQTVCGTGIRISELRYITVEAVKRGEATVSCKGKNRRIFIVDKLKKRLSDYAKRHSIKTGVIFITRSGKPIDRCNVWREMKALCSDANVSPSKVFPHNLRHLFARTFYKIEKDIAKLADILGHSSIDTTRIYIITTGEEHKRKMENMRLII